MSGDKDVRVVLDTNVFVSSILNPHGPPARVVLAVRDGRLRLLTSDAIIDEYIRVLQYPKLQKYLKNREQDIFELTGIFIRDAERIEVVSTVEASPDPDDNKFLEVALDGKARFLVTGDKAHLLSLQASDGFRILTSREIIETLGL